MHFDWPSVLQLLKDGADFQSFYQIVKTDQHYYHTERYKQLYDSLQPLANAYPVRVADSRDRKTATLCQAAYDLYHPYPSAAHGSCSILFYAVDRVAKDVVKAAITGGDNVNQEHCGSGARVQGSSSTAVNALQEARKTVVGWGQSLSRKDSTFVRATLLHVAVSRWMFATEDRRKDVVEIVKMLVKAGASNSRKAWIPIELLDLGKDARHFREAFVERSNLNSRWGESYTEYLMGALDFAKYFKFSSSAQAAPGMKYVSLALPGDRTSLLQALRGR
jgi:hypothetical protein